MIRQQESIFQKYFKLTEELTRDAFKARFFLFLITSPFLLLLVIGQLLAGIVDIEKGVGFFSIIFGVTVILLFIWSYFATIYRRVYTISKNSIWALLCSIIAITPIIGYVVGLIVLFLKEPNEI